MRTCVSIAIFICCIALVSGTQAGSHKTTTFNVPGAGTGQGQGTVAEGVVDDGSIMGYYIDSTGRGHGFLRTSAAKYDKFDPAGSTFTEPLGMNASLEITGLYVDSNGIDHGFVRDSAGKITTFNIAGAVSTIPEDINSSGDTAGYFTDSNGALHGFIRSASGTATKFNAPKAGTGQNQGTGPGGFDAFTDAGELTGIVIDSAGVLHGWVRLASGNIKDFDPTGSVETQVTGIDSAGTVIGFYVNSAGVDTGYTRDSAGTFKTFSVANSSNTEPTNIVSSGAEMAGTYVDSTGLTRGFERTAAGTTSTFAVSGATGTFAESNNDSGVVGGYYLDSAGVYHGFLWQ
jgi:hypothetical protein